MLCENPMSTIKTYHVLNSTTLLPTEMGPLEYDCIETIDMVYCSHLGEGSNETLYGPWPRRKEQWPYKRLTQTCPWLSRSIRGRHGSVVGCCRAGGTECSSACMGPFEWGQHYLQTSTIVWPQVNNREGTHLHPSTKIGLKIYWSWPCPSEKDPDSPSVSLCHQEASINLLHQRADRLKTASQKTNQSDHMDDSLV